MVVDVKQFFRDLIDSEVDGHGCVSYDMSFDGVEKLGLGAYKAVFMFEGDDYVYKISRYMHSYLNDYLFKDSNEAIIKEIQLSETIKVNGFDKYFLLVEEFMRYKGYVIGRQRKAEMDSTQSVASIIDYISMNIIDIDHPLYDEDDQYCGQNVHFRDDILSAESVDEKVEVFNEYENYISEILDPYEIVNALFGDDSLVEFLIDWDLSDFHLGNFGYIGGQPYIIDYSL